jgi:hypothetical protein
MLLAVHFSVVANAQQPPRETAPAYSLLRFEEDYRYLRDPARRTDVWDVVKYMPLDPDRGSYLTLGGELRERLEYYSRPNFGLQGQSANAYLLNRMLLHADLHAGDYLRTFFELGGHFAPWKDAAAPPYLDRWDLQQAFVDVRLPLSPLEDIDPVLRVGRQEMVFGSQRLVSIRDAPNVRRAFDGVRLGDTIDGVRVDAFLTRPVLLREGAFDDVSNDAQAFWGLYTTTPVRFLTGTKADLYYFGFDNDRARFAAGLGAEQRQTIGARFFGGAAGWDWDWEALYQFGDFAEQDIRAWGLSTDTGFTIGIGEWKVRVGLKADTGSGDRNIHDRTLGTLNPLFPKLAYFNQAALFGPSNVIDLQPTLSVQPHERFKVAVGYNPLWRANTQDAIYTGAGVPIAGTAGQPGRFTAHQLSADLTWQLDRHVQLTTGYVHVDVADVLKAAGGHDVDFVYASAAYKF